MEPTKMKKLLYAKNVIDSHTQLMETFSELDRENPIDLKTQLLITELERDYLLNTITSILRQNKHINKL